MSWLSFLQGMGVHGVSRLRKRDPSGGDPVATEDNLYYMGQEASFDLANLTFR
jgi:hypothetical protein